MKIKNVLLAVAAVSSMCGPAFAGQGGDTSTVERDYTLSNGAGTTGPGMSGYLHQGMADHATQTTSIHNGKHGRFRVTSGFSRGAVYNNTADISLQRIQ